MDFTNVQDPAGVKALLDSLRSSSVFSIPSTTSGNVETTGGPSTSTAPEEVLEESSFADPSELVPEESTSTMPIDTPVVTLPPAPPSTISSHISSLLSRLQPLFPRTSSSSASKPSSAPPPPQAQVDSHHNHITTSTATTDLRNMSFQQSLMHLGRLLEDPIVISAVKKMKQEQDDVETRLWAGREAIIEKQKVKVAAAREKAKIINSNPTPREVETMKTEFERELLRYDRDNVLIAWDRMVEKQQGVLEQLGFPSMFVTAVDGDRKRQQRIIEVIANAI